MFDIWELLKSVDFASKFKPLLDSLEATDPRFVALLVIILVYLGSKVSSGQPAIRTLGLRLATVAVLLFGGYAYYEMSESESRDYLSMILRSFNAGGIVLALTWIMLPILNFVYTHLRLALAAFLGYSIYAIFTAGAFDPEKLPLIGAKAMIAVALTLVVAWILHPIWDFIKELLPRPAPKPVAAADKPTAAPVIAQAPAPVVAPAPVPVIAPAPAPVLAPPPLIAPAPAPAFAAMPAADLVPLRQEMVSLPHRASGNEENVPALPLAPALLELQRRRDKVRLKIELAYVMAMPAISSRLPRPVFDDFVRRYLGDHLPPEDVEDNSRQLEMILFEHHQQAQNVSEARSVLILQEHPPAPAPTESRSLEDLLRRFLDEQQRAQTLAVEQAIHHHAAADLQPNHKAPIKELLEN